MFQFHYILILSTSILGFLCDGSSVPYNDIQKFSTATNNILERRSEGRGLSLLAESDEYTEPGGLSEDIMNSAVEAYRRAGNQVLKSFNER